MLASQINDSNQGKLGVVYTPAEVASAVSALALARCKKKPLEILEPSAGDGSFFWAVDSISKGYGVFTLVDIDENVTSALQSVLGNRYPSVSLLTGDFIQFSVQTDKRYDLIIGNPPFIRRHDYGANFKSSVASLSEATSFPLKYLKNAWAAFVVASERILSEEGVLAFIVPYELMNVAYGHELQKRIFSRFARVDVYIPDEKAFKKIDQDAVVFIAQKKTDTSGGFYINRVKSLCSLALLNTRKISGSAERNLSLDLKSFLFDRQTLALLHGIRSRCSKVSDFCESAPGIVTAANDFFILSKEELIANELQAHGLPVLKKGSYLPRGPIFSKEDFSEIEKRDPCYFLALKGEEVEGYLSSVLRYIKSGEDLGLDKRYKCRNRKYWYEVPFGSPAAGFFFKRSHEFPRICLNEAGVLVTDTAYKIKPRPGFSMRSICYSFYNSLTLLFSEVDGRFYGGGVLELTPSEFKGLPLVYHEPSDADFQKFIALHYEGRDIGAALARNGDVWLKDKLSLTDSELLQIQLAWKTVRDHRMRHGRAIIM